MSAFSFKETYLFTPMRLGRTARDTLQEFIDIDVTVSDLARILNNNQVYRDLVFRFVNKKMGKAEKPKDDKKEGAKDEPQSATHRLVSLLGMIGSRNLIMALRLHRIVEGRFPINPEGDIEISPGDYLKRAMEAEDLYVRNKLEYSESAYAAGVYFDLCFHRYSKNNGLKKLEPYFKSVWGRAVRTGTVAYFLGEKVQGITPKTAMMAGMLAHAGKLHLAAWFENQKYAEFEEKMDKQDIPVLGRMMLERDMFGVAQEDVGAHTLRYFDIFKSLAPAVANFREPYNLRGADPANHALAVTVHLADAMARTWKLPPDEKDPVFSEWSYPGLGALKIRRSTLIEVLKRAMTLK